jgi:hypothetical protein
VESSSAGVLDRFFAGSAREVFRNSRNDVLPAFWVPMMRMLLTQLAKRFHYRICGLPTYLKGVGSFLLRTLLGLLMVLIALLA